MGEGVPAGSPAGHLSSQEAMLLLHCAACNWRVLIFSCSLPSPAASPSCYHGTRGHVSKMLHPPNHPSTQPLCDRSRVSTSLFMRWCILPCLHLPSAECIPFLPVTSFLYPFIHMPIPLTCIISRHPPVHLSTSGHLCMDPPFHASTHVFISIHSCTYPSTHSYIHHLIDTVQMPVHPAQHPITDNIDSAASIFSCLYLSILTCTPVSIHPFLDSSIHSFIHLAICIRKPSSHLSAHPCTHPLLSCSSHPVQYPYPLFHPFTHSSLSILPLISINLSSHLSTPLAAYPCIQ